LNGKKYENNNKFLTSRDLAKVEEGGEERKSNRRILSIPSAFNCKIV